MSNKNDFSCEHDETVECAVESCDHSAKPEYGRFCGVHKSDYYKAKATYFEGLAEMMSKELSDVRQRYKDALMKLGQMKQTKDRTESPSTAFLWVLATHVAVALASVAVTYAVMK